ncbi:response regulator transcription factor [bacterium BMS3Abin03]|jgi:DNA-binding NarL/FixJ family response regulator|nr:response regulator transcription factor [bacterium BMS3Abin03]MCG6961290.1 response regulator transcription factor [bacterium BMS3Abin03]
MKQNPKIKVLIADDHTLFRKGIIKILNELPQVFVIGEAENGEELIKKYFELYPDVILVDIAMPIMSGPAAINKILKRDPKAKALFLSMYDSEEYIYRVLDCGGKGLISKDIVEGELTYALETVFNGEKYFRGDWNDKKLEDLVKRFESRQINFTDSDDEINFREEQILKYINDGLSSKDMAEKLNISKKTIDFYRSSLMKRFDLKTPTELVRFAIKYFEDKGE